MDLRLTRQGGHATLEAQDEVLDWKGATKKLNIYPVELVVYLCFSIVSFHSTTHVNNFYPLRGLADWS